MVFALRGFGGHSTREIPDGRRFSTDMELQLISGITKTGSILVIDFFTSRMGNVLRRLFHIEGDIEVDMFELNEYLMQLYYHGFDPAGWLPYNHLPLIFEYNKEPVPENEPDEPTHYIVSAIRSQRPRIKRR